MIDASSFQSNMCCLTREQEARCQNTNTKDHSERSCLQRVCVASSTRLLACMLQGQGLTINRVACLLVQHAGRALLHSSNVVNRQARKVHERWMALNLSKEAAAAGGPCICQVAATLNGTWDESHGLGAHLSAQQLALTAFAHQLHADSPNWLPLRLLHHTIWHCMHQPKQFAPPADCLVSTQIEGVNMLNLSNGHGWL